VKTLFSLLLAVVSQLTTPGHLFVHMQAGYEIIVDGTSIGVTANDVGGKIVDLAPGRHRVAVRSADGREGAFDIDVVSGQTSDVSPSPLGLRKKLSTEGEPGSLHVVCVPEDCSIMFRDKDRMTNDDILETVPAGRYPFAATRGASTLRTNVDVPSGTVVTLEANFNTRTTRVVETHRRARHLTVAENNDALATLNVPAFWKSAIRSSLPAGVTVYQAVEVAPNGIRATLHIPTPDVGYSFVEGLMESNAFSKIGASTPRREQIGWVIDIAYYFPPAR
jgi:hypothetical protein